MQLIYEGKNITNAIEIKKADFTDRAGGVADSLELWLNDPAGLWSKWKPEKNHKIQIKQAGADSGIMYVDELEQKKGTFIIRALSLPREAKTTHTKAWEEVRFMEIATEIATKYGFQLLTYGIQNHLYNRLDQYERADFSFLAWLCMLEGYMLKITDNKVVIYDERYMEIQEPIKTIYSDEFDGDYTFKSISNGIYGSCRLTHGNISYAFNPANVYGPELKVSDLYVSSLSEAERFSKGLLRAKNKSENRGYGTIKLDPQIAAGSTVRIRGIGLADGKYFCEEVIHHHVNEKTFLRLRKPLGGY